MCSASPLINCNARSELSKGSAIQCLKFLSSTNTRVKQIQSEALKYTITCIHIYTHTFSAAQRRYASTLPALSPDCNDGPMPKGLLTRLSCHQRCIQSSLTPLALAKLLMPVNSNCKCANEFMQQCSPSIPVRGELRPWQLDSVRTLIGICPGVIIVRTQSVSLSAFLSPLWCPRFKSCLIHTPTPEWNHSGEESKMCSSQSRWLPAAKRDDS